MAMTITDEFTSKAQLELSFWKQCVAGVLSTRAFKVFTGKCVYIGGKRDNCKWSREELRRLPGASVRNPKVVAHINAQHNTWRKKKGFAPL